MCVRFPIKVIVSAYVMLLTLNPALSNWKPMRPAREKLCTSIPCQQRAKKYFLNLNPSFHPCDNFFEFACGNWLQQYPSPKYASDWSIADILTKNMLQIIRSLLEDTWSTSIEPEFRVLQTIYNSCTRIPYMERQEPRRIAYTIMQVGRYPDTSLWDLHNKYLKLTGESAFFDIAVVAYKLTDNHPLLVLVEPESPFGSIYHELAWKKDEEKAYLDFLYLAMESLGLDTRETIEKQALEVLQFRKKFNKIARKTKKDQHQRLGPMTPRKMQALLQKPQYRDSQKIPCVEIARILLRDLPKFVADHQKIMDIRHKGYFFDLINLLGETPNAILAAHIELYFIERHLEYSFSMYKSLESTSIEPYTLQQTIRVDKYKRWEDCLETFNAQGVLGKLYLEKWFAAGDQEIVHKLLSDVKEAVKLQTDLSTWLDKNSRYDLENSLDTLGEWIGFPPWYKNHSIPRPDNANSYELLIPNASIDLHRKIFYIRASLLASPVFDPNMPQLYNYAGLGAAIGHELYHLVHDCGSISPANSTIPKKVWWPLSTRKACFLRKLCYVTQYNEITKKEFFERYGYTVPNVDTRKSFTENFPDSMGLQAAYIAFKLAQKKNPNFCKTFSIFRDYSCDQMFFITYANAFCGYSTLKSAIHKLENGVHSLNSIRVNGAVSNSLSFASAFECPRGSRMNPEKRCNIWD